MFTQLYPWHYFVFSLLTMKCMNGNISKAVPSLSILTTQEDKIIDLA